MNTPTHKLGQAMQHMVECGKRPCFRIDGLRITIASEVSANPGALYIKNDDWEYIGKVTPEGLMKIAYPSLITCEQKILVLAAITDPEGTAMSNGKATGTCCCCGRTLTNKFSIELGIGPICRGFWFPGHTSEAITPTDTVAMLETLDAISPSDADLAVANQQLDIITESLGQICFKHPNMADANCPDCVQDAVNCLVSLEIPTKEPVVELVNGYFALTPIEQHLFLGTIKKELVK